VRCLVCGRETPDTHMGMDVCRACEVFYKRNKPVEETLYCIEGNRTCTEFQKGNYSCRLCRFDRFNEVMKSCTEVNNEVAILPRCSIDVPSISIPLQVNELSIVERVREYYIKLSTIRRNNELAFRGVQLDPYKAEKEEYAVTPCTFRVMNESVRIMLSTLFDFANALFPEFKGFPIEDKWILVRNFQNSFHCLETHMRSQRIFSTDSGKYFVTYTTFLSTDASRVYFSDCLNQEH
ncbi:hypothetical protein PFISCL1PPCAC_14433, partial [Pristionchus fissidentatus]